MRTRVHLLGRALLMLALASPVAGQVSQPSPVAVRPAPTIVELQLKDGSIIFGVVEQESPDRLVLRTLAGAVVEVSRTQVVSMQPARGQVVDGQFWRADSNATRLFFAPTGRSLEKGTGYLGVYEFLLPFVQFGVTDRFSIGAGTPLIFFGDESGRPIWVTPKYQVYKGSRTSTAIGVMHFFVLGESSRVGLAYAATTIGANDNALTIGGGWAYARYEETDALTCPVSPPGMPVACTADRTTEVVGAPVLMVGGERRLRRNLKLITENYAFEDGGIVSVGVRFLGERLSADLGVFAPVTSEDVFVLAPIVNFVWTFGRSATASRPPTAAR
jgi:hypothetical protein